MSLTGIDQLLAFVSLENQPSSSDPLEVLTDEQYNALPGNSSRLLPWVFCEEDDQEPEIKVKRTDSRICQTIRMYIFYSEILRLFSALFLI
jgi:hypothetical protein